MRKRDRELTKKTYDVHVKLSQAVVELLAPLSDEQIDETVRAFGTVMEQAQSANAPEQVTIASATLVQLSMLGTQGLVREKLRRLKA